MAVNWVMLSATEGFVKLPSERILYTSPPRTSLSLATPNQYPGNQPFSASSSTGCVHLTNQRLVYLPANQTSQLQSFSAPILHVHNSHVSTPFFGPNVWEADIRPVTGGGLPGYRLLLKLTFKDGGAYDFSQVFERLKERLRQVVELAAEEGEDPSNVSTLSSNRLASVHLEDLPAYEESSIPAIPQAQPIHNHQPLTEQQPNSSSSSSDSGQRSIKEDAPSDEAFAAPLEPPPNYEEAQRQSVAEHLEESLRRAEERGGT